MLQKNATVEYFDVNFVNNDIYNVNNTNEGFELSLVVGATANLLSVPNNIESFTLLDTVSNKQKPVLFLNNIVSDSNVPVAKTDESGIDWVRIGFQVTQLESNNGGAVEVENLKIVYNLEHQIGQDGEFASYLREFVAISNQASSQSSGIANTSSSRNILGITVVRLVLSNLTVTSESGYDSTLTWNSQYNGLYSTGELYHITTTHNVDASTGASLENVR